FWRKIMAGYFGSGLGHKIAKTTPCKVGWARPTAPARYSRRACDLRQLQRAPQRLLDQLVGIDEDAQAEQPAFPELGEMRQPQADWFVGIQRSQRIAHHRGRGIDAQQDRLAVEAMD